MHAEPQALLISSMLVACLVAPVGLISAEGEIAKDARGGVREVNKSVEHDDKEVDKDVRRLEKDRHQDGSHIDKEVKKAS